MTGSAASGEASGKDDAAPESLPSQPASPWDSEATPSDAASGDQSGDLGRDAESDVILEPEALWDSLPSPHKPAAVPAPKRKAVEKDKAEKAASKADKPTSKAAAVPAAAAGAPQPEKAAAAAAATGPNGPTSPTASNPLAASAETPAPPPPPPPPLTVVADVWLNAAEAEAVCAQAKAEPHQSGLHPLRGMLATPHI